MSGRLATLAALAALTLLDTGVEPQPFVPPPEPPRVPEPELDELWRRRKRAPSARVCTHSFGLAGGFSSCAVCGKGAVKGEVRR